MGIKGLWNVLTPFSEKKSLHEIRGETVAIDLSGWVCDSQNVTDYHIQPKLYLRNLFFRTLYLLLADIVPIFVLEGDAPELKRDVMTARNAIQFRGAAPKAGNVKGKETNVTRRRFKGVLKECENLLNSMGVRCVKGRGEAEATCARLNAKGMVNAVISQDSDCFAYGARRVYRNFSVSSSAGGGAMQGSIDCYDADVMFKNNGFGRKKMVALALLCGCDYGVGACGSSIGTVVSFLHTVPEEDVVFRLLSWVSEPQKYEEQARWAARPGVCDRCGHAGRTHNKHGCPVCATHRACHDHQHKAKVSEVKRELSLRSRALSSGMPFPEPKVMKEFLDTTPEDIDIGALKMPSPSLILFVKIMSQKLEWSEKYCVEKFLPLLTKWHLQDHVPIRTIKPITIKKKRNPRGVPSYEVVWEDIDGQYDALIPDDQFEEGEDVLSVWTSIERQDLMRKHYPDLAEAYEESIKKPPKENKGKGRKKKEAVSGKEEPKKPKRKYTKKQQKNSIAELSKSLGNLSITNVAEITVNKSRVSVSVNKLKRKIKSKSKCKNTIESYLKPVKKKKSNTSKSFNFSLKNISSDNLKPIYLLDDFDKENDPVLKDDMGFSILDVSRDDVSENDLSDIIDKITSRQTAATTAKVNNDYVKLVFNKKISLRKSILTQRFNQNCSTPNQSPSKNKFNGPFAQKPINTSYFFDKLTDECDAFEMSLEHKSAVINISDATIDYSLPDVRL